MRSALLLTISLAVLGPSQGQAQGQAQSPGAGSSGTTVSGVTVVMRRATPVSGVTVAAAACPEPNPTRYTADPAPAVVDTYPAQGAVVAPGALVLRASFSAPMSCYWEVSSQSDSEDDPCQDVGDWSLPDRTRWTMVCTLKPNARYTIRFGRTDGQGFVGRSGRNVPPYVLTFSTSDEPPLALEAARSADPAKAPAGSVVACSAKPAPGADDCVRMAAGTPP